jgi:hypothetical protein
MGVDAGVSTVLDANVTRLQQVLPKGQVGS